MPAHTHTYNVSSGADAQQGGGDADLTTISGSTTGSTGGGGAHSNLQPSKTLYIWKRTA